jgi:hypothetical protein
MIYRYVYKHTYSSVPLGISLPKSTPRVLLLPRPVTRRHLVGDLVCQLHVVADQRVEHKAELAAVEAFQRRPHLRRRRVCRRTKGARAMGGIAVWIRQDRRAAGALHRCTAIYMMHEYPYMQHWGTICAMSGIGVPSVDSDCSCTARASNRSACRRINSTAAFVGFRGL